MSCNDSKKNRSDNIATTEESSNDFVRSLTSADTTSILNISKSCMELLKSEKLDEAFQALRILDNGNLRPLTEKNKQALRNRLRFFPVLDYQLEHYQLINDSSNIVKYRVTFMIDKDNNNNNRATAFMLNPIKVNGKWFLTINNK